MPLHIAAAAVLLVSCFAAGVSAEIVRVPHEYRDGDAVLEGAFVYDNAITAKRPGVLVVHQWMGITDHERTIARRLAELGYFAFIADIYGKGVHPDSPAAAGKLAGQFKSDIPMFRRRVNAALDQLKANDQVDTHRVAAIGFCFGGTAVLELARSGADLAGVVSFHGGLSTPHPEDAKNIKCKVLVCHGADDPHAPRKQVEALMDELEAAGVDYQVILYGHAVHAFTQPEAGNDPSRGAAYNEPAARRSWQHMQLFFDEIFRKKS